MKKKLFLARSLVLFASINLAGFAGAGIPNAKIREQVRAYRVANEARILQEFIALLAIPNVASDRENIRKNAAHIAEMLKQRGLEPELLAVDDSPPVVFAELKTPGAKRTLVLYAHYDGQPVVPSQWNSPPWQPTLRDKTIERDGREIPLTPLPAKLDPEWRLYARSSGDDKAPIVALLAALDAMRASKISPSVNVKFFFEGEEEAGSPHLQKILENHARLLESEAWLLLDGPVHQTRRPLVYFGARGVCGAELTVYGPLRPLHSGHYGNWAPNPALMLARLIGSMRDEDGRILIEGFYEEARAITATERSALLRVPEVDVNLRKQLGLARTEADNALLVERIMLPALNVRGLQSGGVGAAATNAIPSEAHASLDFRLVPEQTPEKVRTLLERHLQQQGYHIVSATPDSSTRQRHEKIVKLEWENGYPPARTSMDLPVSRALIEVLEETLQAPVVQMPTVGGSIPMHLFMETLKVPVIVVPIANHDNNQHAANENLRLQNLWDGIELYAGLLAGIGRAWK